MQIILNPHPYEGFYANTQDSNHLRIPQTRSNHGTSAATTAAAGKGRIVSHLSASTGAAFCTAAASSTAAAPSTGSAPGTATASATAAASATGAEDIMPPSN